MPHQNCTTVYFFDELSDSAKERAREWLRRAQAEDPDWYEFTYDDAIRMATILGITIGTRTQRWSNTSTGASGQHTTPSIYFSGFSSQGDGACFEGTYEYAKGAHKAIRAEAPQDTTLHGIADDLVRLQKAHAYKLTATVKHRGHYYHEYCTDISVDCSCPRCRATEGTTAETDKALADILRAFMKWIYRQLEAEDEYRNADAQVDETIRANEYEFTEDGRRA